MCSLYINGSHGKTTRRGVTTCQLYIVSSTMVIRKVLAMAFCRFSCYQRLYGRPYSFDKIIQAGGYVTVHYSCSLKMLMLFLIPKQDADEAMDCASSGCGACVAACKNGSAMLFVSSKVSQLQLCCRGTLPEAARAVPKP